VAHNFWLLSQPVAPPGGVRQQRLPLSHSLLVSHFVHNFSPGIGEGVLVEVIFQKVGSGGSNGGGWVSIRITPLTVQVELAPRESYGFLFMLLLLLLLSYVCRGLSGFAQGVRKLGILLT